MPNRLSGCSPTPAAQAYDLEKMKLLKSLFRTTAGCAVAMHVFLGFTVPVAGACIMLPMQLWDCKAIHIHLSGKTYERPFEMKSESKPGLLARLMSMAGGATVG